MLNLGWIWKIKNRILFEKKLKINEKAYLNMNLKMKNKILFDKKLKINEKAYLNMKLKMM